MSSEIKLYFFLREFVMRGLDFGASLRERKKVRAMSMALKKTYWLALQSSERRCLSLKRMYTDLFSFALLDMFLLRSCRRESLSDNLGCQSLLYRLYQKHQELEWFMRSNLGLPLLLLFFIRSERTHLRRWKQQLFWRRYWNVSAMFRMNQYNPSINLCMSAPLFIAGTFFGSLSKVPRTAWKKNC